MKSKTALKPQRKAKLTGPKKLSLRTLLLVDGYIKTQRAKNKALSQRCTHLFVSSVSWPRNNNLRIREMRQWWLMGYFTPDLLVRRVNEDDFVEISTREEVTQGKRTSFFSPSAQTNGC